VTALSPIRKSVERLTVVYYSSRDKKLKRKKKPVTVKRLSSLSYGGRRYLEVRKCAGMFGKETVGISVIRRTRFFFVLSVLLFLLTDALEKNRKSKLRPRTPPRVHDARRRVPRVERTRVFNYDDDDDDGIV